MVLAYDSWILPWAFLLYYNAQIRVQTSLPGVMLLPDHREQHVGRQIHQPAFVELVRDSWSEVWHW